MKPLLRIITVILIALLLVIGCGRKANPPGLNTRQDLPPRLVFLSQADDHHLSLEFDRPLDEASLGEFTLEGQDGEAAAEVVLVRLEPTNPRIILLDVNGLRSGETYQLTARNLRGSDGLLAEPLRREFIATEDADVTPPKSIKLAPYGETSNRPAIYLIYNEAIAVGAAAATLTEATESDSENGEPPATLELTIEAEQNRVSLLLPADEALEPGTGYNVMVSGVTDLAGNPAEDSTWLLEVRSEEAGGQLEVRVGTADGSPLPAEIELLLSPTPDGRLPIARAGSSDGLFSLSGLGEYRAADSPYLIVCGEEGGVSFEGFYDEDGNGTADQLGALRPGELHQVELTLFRQSNAGPLVSLTTLARGTVATLTVTALATDEAGVAEVEAFLDRPGSDGTGLNFAVLPWEGLSGDRELRACLPLSITDWEEGEERLLFVHARNGAGRWGEFSTLTLTRPAECLTTSGKLLFEDSALVGGYAALVDANWTTQALDKSDDYGRFTLPVPEDGERIIAFQPSESALLVSFANPAEITPRLALHPWAAINELAASVVRFDQTSELELPEDYLLVEAALTEPAGKVFTYGVKINGESQSLTPDMSGRIAARLTLPAELPDDASFSVTDAAGESLVFSSENLLLQHLGFTTVTAVDEGTELRLSWSPVPGAAGYEVVLIPRDRFSADRLSGEGVWSSRPHRLQITELVIAEGEVEDYWGVPGGTRYIVAVCALGADSGDQAWSFGELVHP